MTPKDVFSMEEVVAHLVHTDALASIESRRCKPRFRANGPSLRYRRHVNALENAPEPGLSAIAVKGLSMRVVPHKNGVAVERVSGRGYAVRAPLPLARSEIDRHNGDLARATSGSAYSLVATREVRQIIMSRMLFAKSRASSRNRDFNLTIEGLCELFNEQRGLCAVTGLPMDIGKTVGGATKWRKPFRLSLDRIDSSLGYTPENVRLVCAAVNNALGAWGEAVFAVIAQAFMTNRNAPSGHLAQR